MGKIEDSGGTKAWGMVNPDFQVVIIRNCDSNNCVCVSACMYMQLFTYSMR